MDDLHLCTIKGLGCDEFYIPPDGGLDLRGFSAAATFVRGIFDKIGIEPQVLLTDQEKTNENMIHHVFNTFKGFQHVFDLP